MWSGCCSSAETQAKRYILCYSLNFFPIPHIIFEGWLIENDPAVHVLGVLLKLGLQSGFILQIFKSDVSSLRQDINGKCHIVSMNASRNGKKASGPKFQSAPVNISLSFSIPEWAITITLNIRFSSNSPANWRVDSSSGVKYILLFCVYRRNGKEL